MTTNIKLGSRVEANRNIENKDINKFDKGTVTFIENIDSELYLNIEMDNGKFVFQSSENCWNSIS